MGDLPEFFQVYASDEIWVNILSFANVEDLYEINYMQKQAFVVHMKDKDLVFNRHEKLFVADLYKEENVVQATVRENESLYMREEVKRAKEALRPYTYLWMAMYEAYLC